MTRTPQTIRRVCCATRTKGVTREEFAAAWPAAVAVAARAPEGVRPVRVAVNTVLPEVAEPRHDGIEVAWFTDRAHADRFAAWQTTEGRAARRDLAELTDPASPVLLATEAVMRGADWLAARWHDPSPRLKHLALATRAAGLTPEEFSARWRAHAGSVRRPGEPGPTPIPDEARGFAYVQSHPLPGLPRAYDALTEVYFTTRESLAARVAWFAAAPAADPALFATSHLLPARETVLA
ncbi:hypothetical protein [Actinocorallia sp. A-T 12471]|uniref:hypothetical protein n=1 Tax=Actinocorallia sp. A-T 12471 TaxID=3089813 RepID=UPI0029D3A1B8|nr:hypothetical protein [Actinocorallia sp. A-T 12471]MDX6745128.1 hypothetical protein [Actinocorallia sp. A-T 12471]